ncbi:mitogen-activated protein kinase [Exophiala dermatitidis]|nr:mitogen-activated protein kinase [Exophiala dermatitidis]KAJ4527988.1 mitogen-activated protein kinase [Exophiala dermatitidis]KAJ4528621.1 mitogen-activated protein kinase [Exophiala dermatitidis]KAJ4529996.1 mitogen-activated protein kinase, variant 2 [Exophiala dermatitidis]KAJ4552967.1 mitogen-activated protein kinase [Exophiala dermatitidis]
MTVEISFADRLSTIVALTNAFQSAGKQPDEAQKEARELEDKILHTASSSGDYQQTLDNVIVDLQGPPAETIEKEDPLEEHEILNTDGPSFGAYRYATFHADGQMSTVFKAEAKDTTAPVRIVALKVTYPAMMTPPHNSEREARLLVEARHENVVPLLETVHESRGRLILVFPFLRQDLENLLGSGRLDKRQASMVFQGLFRALEHIHALGIIHRDVKPSNILLKSMDGPVYLADFGIAWSPDDEDSEPADSKITDVGTTCYRPPELLFGHRYYDTSLDIWAAGCVVAEMIRNGHEPIFDAGPLGSELGLIKSMFTTLGTPDDESWPSAKRYPDWGKMRFQSFPAKSWKEILPGATEQGIDFVSKTVCYESTRRLTAKQALEHELASTIGRR